MMMMMMMIIIVLLYTQYETKITFRFKLGKIILFISSQKLKVVASKIFTRCS